MNYKHRETRFAYAYVSLGVAFFLGVDALANLDEKDYYHDFALHNILGFVGFAFLMFTWNYIQLTRYRKRNK